MGPLGRVLIEGPLLALTVFLERRGPSWRQRRLLPFEKRPPEKLPAPAEKKTNELPAPMRPLPQADAAVCGALALHQRPHAGPQGEAGAATGGQRQARGFRRPLTSGEGEARVRRGGGFKSQGKAPFLGVGVKLGNKKGGTQQL